MATALPADPRPIRVLTPLQWVLLALPLGALVLLLLVLQAFYPDRTALLWTDPLGQKMLAGELTLLLAGGLAYALGSGVTNRFLTGAAALAARCVVAALWYVGFCLPVGFLLLVGPTAVEVRRALIPG